MPIKRSAEKELRKSIKRRAVNAARTTEISGLIKRYRTSPTKEALSVIYKKLDKAVKTNLIKANKAARMKSALAKLSASRATRNV